MAAAYAGKAEVVRLLLQAGASCGIRSGTGKTALAYAAYADRTECVRALVAAGADARIKDNDGNTALMTALSSSYANGGDDPALARNGGYIALAKKARTTAL